MNSAEKSILEKIPQADLFGRVGDICNTVNSTTRKGELLEISLIKILKLFNASRGSIFLLDDKKKELKLYASVGLEKKEDTKMFKRIGEGVVGKVAQLKEPIFVEDISQDSRFQNYKSRSNYKTPSFMCAPLMVKDELIGVINITDKESGNKFRGNEIQLLDFLSTQVALNLRRIELYNRFKKIIEETNTLKNKLGEKDQETEYLKKQIYIQDKLATIGKLAGGIAHEFNNPIDGVLRYTNLCLDHVESDNVIHGYLLEIKHGLKRMESIVRNLLSCSRNSPIKNNPINISQAIEDALSSLTSDMHYKNVEIEKDVSNTLPEINDLGIDRILINLIHNALDSVDDRGKISIAAKLENETIMLSITDNGKGIPNDKINKIFEPFYTTKDMERGCGLGLTIVGEIIKCYNGTICVESEEGKSTTFKINLPLSR